MLWIVWDVRPFLSNRLQFLLLEFLATSPDIVLTTCKPPILPPAHPLYSPVMFFKGIVVKGPVQLQRGAMA